MTETKRNIVTRQCKFDAGHRVMHERFKCYNVHGHEYQVFLTFSYATMEEIGYAIDFKEIKRIACQWIDDVFDHGFIANPADKVIIEACRAVESKLYLMNMVDDNGYCNPSAENIAKELFFGVSTLMDDGNLKLESIKMFETVNCSVECFGLTNTEFAKLRISPLYRELQAYKEAKGSVEYDSRKA